MVYIATAATFFALSSVVVSMPFSKRISQISSDAKQPWEFACVRAGGGSKCNDIGVLAAATVLAAAIPCAQQNIADRMIDFAVTLPNNTEMIRLTQIFVQQPRNTVSQFIIG